MHISMIGVVIIIASAILSGCEKTPEDDQKYIEGMNYYFGNGVPIDYEKAAGLLMVSAENNNPAAETVLGEMYFYGRGVKRDYKKSEEWYSKAAKSNYQPAQVRMAEFASGFEEKIKLLLPLAEKGNAEAQRQLGGLYQTTGITAGSDRSEYFERAIKWLRLSANQDRYALISLSLMYQNGWGVEVDPVAAYALLTNASEAGYEYAADDVLGSLKAEMNPMEVEDGITLANRMANDDPLKELDRHLTMKK